MQISVSGHHVQVTEAIEAYIRKKLNKLDKHFQPILNGKVLLSVEKNTQKAETTLHISGVEVFVEAQSNNLYASIDKMSKKLDRKVIEMKRKSVSKRHQSVSIEQE